MNKPSVRLLTTIRRMRQRNARRWPEWVRREVLAYAAQCRAERRTWAQVADDLGMSHQTLRRWCLAAEQASCAVALAPVEVMVATESPLPPARLLSLTSPAGYRVDGLDVAAAASLLRALS